MCDDVVVCDHDIENVHKRDNATCNLFSGSEVGYSDPKLTCRLTVGDLLNLERGAYLTVDDAVCRRNFAACVGYGLLLSSSEEKSFSDVSWLFRFFFESIERVFAKMAG